MKIHSNAFSVQLRFVIWHRRQCIRRPSIGQMELLEAMMKQWRVFPNQIALPQFPENHQLRLIKRLSVCKPGKCLIRPPSNVVSQTDRKDQRSSPKHWTSPALIFHDWWASSAKCHAIHTKAFYKTIPSPTASTHHNPECMRNFAINNNVRHMRHCH